MRRGFTLIEILVALFVFSIISLMLMRGLETVIAAEEATEEHAERLHDLQLAMLVLSRDIEQTINRPILNAYGKQEETFIGTNTSMTFTHLGYAQSAGLVPMSGMQRTGYFISEGKLWRKTWPVLDQAPQTKDRVRVLLPAITQASFSYLDKDGKFQTAWPIGGQPAQVLPRAVKISLTIAKWGSLTSLYVIPATASNANQVNPATKPAS